MGGGPNEKNGTLKRQLSLFFRKRETTFLGNRKCVNRSASGPPETLAENDARSDGQCEKRVSAAQSRQH